MTTRSYKVIFILLSCCILFILGSQGYWIRNFYLQKKDGFERSVYSTLEQLSTKLQERKSLQALKMTYIIQNGDTIAKTPSRNMRFASEENIKIINNHKEVETMRVISLGKEKKIKDSIYINGKENGVNIILNGKKAKITVFNKGRKQDLKDLISESDKLVKDSKEITGLVDKMITEIKVMDTETENADSLKILIRKTLDNKGLFLPFEFSIRSIKERKEEIKVQSKDFLEGAPSYKSNLSAGKIIDTHEFLFLQFPEQDDFVLAGMKSSIVLSVCFSFLIIGVFYYVIRLIRNQKKLTEIKNDFVNNMTHELKTPIATISLAIDAINNPSVKNNEEKFLEYCRILKEENQKMNMHVERVLQLALLEKGELLPDQQRVNVSGVIRDVISGYSLRIAEQKAEVIFNPAEQALFMNADKQQLITVFSNLLDNALKYSSAHCRIEIVITKYPDEIRISVKDNGIGISADKKEKIFEKFYRIQGGNLHDIKGFGLGLSYVKSLVEANGGRVELGSEPGKGSEFVLIFKA